MFETPTICSFMKDMIWIKSVHLFSWIVWHVFFYFVNLFLTALHVFKIFPSKKTSFALTTTP